MTNKAFWVGALAAVAAVAFAASYHTGRQLVTPALTLVGPPNLGGPLYLGQSRTFDYALTNHTKRVVSITEARASCQCFRVYRDKSGTTVFQTPFALAPGANIPLYLRLTAETGVGSHEASITLATNHSDAKSLQTVVRYMVLPIAEVVPRSLSFGDIAPGDAQTKTIALLEPDGAPPFEFARFEGVSTAELEIKSLGSGGIGQLAKGIRRQTRLAITYTASAVSFVSTFVHTVQLRASDPSLPALEMQISGRVVPKLAAAPHELFAVGTAAGETKVVPFWVRFKGDGDSEIKLLAIETTGACIKAEVRGDSGLERQGFAHLRIPRAGETTTGEVRLKFSSGPLVISATAIGVEARTDATSSNPEQKQ